MGSFIKEFKEFISKGSVMDMAVGIIIGSAFTAIVTSLVEDILMPIIGVIGGGHGVDELSIKVGSAVIAYGKFISAIINFLLIALVLFMIIKAMNKARSIVVKEEEEAPETPTTKICPRCKSEVNIEATRCPFCTSDL